MTLVFPVAASKRRICATHLWSLERWKTDPGSGVRDIAGYGSLLHLACTHSGGEPVGTERHPDFACMLSPQVKCPFRDGAGPVGTRFSTPSGCGFESRPPYWARGPGRSPGAVRSVAWRDSGGGPRMRADGSRPPYWMAAPGQRPGVVISVAWPGFGRRPAHAGRRVPARPTGPRSWARPGAAGPVWLGGIREEARACGPTGPARPTVTAGRRGFFLEIETAPRPALHLTPIPSLPRASDRAPITSSSRSCDAFGRAALRAARSAGNRRKPRCVATAPAVRWGMRLL